MNIENELNLPAGLFLRDDLSLMVQVGDKAVEMKLAPTAALELAERLLSLGLAAARDHAAARSGALSAIAAAHDRVTPSSEESNDSATEAPRAAE